MPVTILVTVETVLLILMLILVAGLLRSHAEILRRLEASGGVAGNPGPEITPNRAPGAQAFDLSGETVDRGSIGVAVAGSSTNTLIAFLSSGCLTCKGFWDSLRDRTARLPNNVRLAIVTRDSSYESPSKIRALAPDDIAVVMSSAAWDDYQVPMSPYFVFVHGASGTISGEGTAQTWPQVLSLLRDAVEDEATGATGGRFGRADKELHAAGIDSEHPSLYEPDDPALFRDLDVVD
ncbi:MAG: hypothetical protein ABR579_05380 [Actinomycetota bacterium]